VTCSGRHQPACSREWSRRRDRRTRDQSCRWRTRSA